MKEATNIPSTLTIGIDLGDRKSHVCVLDAAGDVVPGRGPTSYRKETAPGVRLGSGPEEGEPVHRVLDRSRSRDFTRSQ